MTKLNIKNARQLETSIVGLIQQKKLKLAIRNNRVLFPTVIESTQSTKERVETILGNIVELDNFRLQIRVAISEFNEKSGINKLTAEIAKVSCYIETLQLLLDIGEPYPQTSHYNSSKTAYTPGLSEDDLDSVGAEIMKSNRKIQRLKDKCNGINYSGYIHLDDSVIARCQNLGLLD